MKTPSLEEALAAIVAKEELSSACAALGCDRATLVSVLRAEMPLFSLPAGVRERLAAPVAPPRAVIAAPVAAPAVEAVKATRATLYSDGASRGNPGPAGAGAVLVLEGGRQVRLGRYLGVQTNNVAEYQGVILGLEKAAELGVRELDVKADSMLAIMQLRGEWKLKNEGLKPLFSRARELAGRFERVRYAHIPREQNAAADEMSNRAIDEKM